MKLSLVAVALALAVAGCASDGEESATTVPSTGSGTTTEDTGTTAPASSTTTADTTTTTAAPPSIASDLGVEEIEQLTATSGQGTRPVLEWAPLAGADRYFVFVNAPSGAIYWGWRTSDTSVPVGGSPRLDEAAAGPAVSDGMSWVVVAFDAAGNLVGISPRRPISP